jgi:hypothetical protein
MKELGIEPPRSRRYLIRWREKFRNGEYGVGGDLKEVTDGMADLRVVEMKVPDEELAKASRYVKLGTASKAPGTIKKVVNVPLDAKEPSEGVMDAKPVKFMKVRGVASIVGPHIEVLKGTEGMGARLRIKEGLWEDKRGRKIDGGERRRAEVRAKRQAQLNKERREKEGA